MLKKANIDWTAKQLNKLAQKGLIQFDNAIQRGYVWDVKRKSLLIHSMLVGYPIPPFYAAKNGEGYESYLKYRKDAIKRAYSDGIIMCKSYNKSEENKRFIENAEKYYEKILEAKKININIKSYLKILSGKNLFKKSIREIVLFHFPIIGYLKYKKIKKCN